MRESFLHYLWRTRRFDLRDLETTQQQNLQILHPGEYNTHSGPDFFNARVNIDGTLWAGNVEMHLLSSEWHAHKHQHDPAYDSVILHVVLQEDLPVFRPDGSRIPCLTLQGRIPETLLGRYEQLESSRLWIPCETSFAEAPEIIKQQWLDRLLIERLEEKTDLISHSLLQCGNHWEEALYQIVARCFGLKVNTEPFEALARSLPLKILARHRHQPHQVEALVFGQAGLLHPVFQDEWPALLQREYRHLAHKYELVPLKPEHWKFFRLRPSGFPTVRLAQFAAFLQQSEHTLAKILEAGTIEEVEQLFHVSPSDYWLNHYQFDKLSIPQPKPLTPAFIEILLVNGVAPFLFHYGKLKGLDRPQQQAFALLEKLPAEKNSLLDGWKTLGSRAANAYQSQALIQLKTRYCDARRCLECAIGNAILK